MIVIDKKVPLEVKENLTKIDQLLELETSGIVYDAISGHPDIFFSQIGEQLLVAPNLPEPYFQKLKDQNISFVLGEEAVGTKYPASSKYNVVADADYLIHNFRNTDSVITQLAEDMDLIQVDQGYTRCNLIPLGNKHYITSDKGVERTLKRYNLEVLYVDPEGIQLSGYKNGFIGGCVGIKGKQIFFMGSLNHLKNSQKINDFLKSQNFELIELYKGPLFDGGSILFL